VRRLKSGYLIVAVLQKKIPEKLEKIISKAFWLAFWQGCSIDFCQNVKQTEMNIKINYNYLLETLTFYFYFLSVSCFDFGKTIANNNTPVFVSSDCYLCP
jgi:hypothetical protein